MSAELVERLKDSFNYDMYLFNSLQARFAQSERISSQTWIERLRKQPSDIEEMKLRNHYMRLLVVYAQNGVLRHPFTQDPPTGPLPELSQQQTDELNKSLLEGLDQDESYIAHTQAFYASRDAANFLQAHPAPRCGAFCYLAVVNNKKER